MQTNIRNILIIFKKQSIQVAVLLLLVLLAMYFLFPIVWLIISSTKDTKELLSTGIFTFPRKIHLFTNIKDLLYYDSGIFIRWASNSLVYAGTVAFFTTLLSAMAGFVLAKYKFVGNKLIFTVILASLMIPGTITTIPLYIIERPLNLVNTYAGLILPLIANPFGVYFLKVYVEDVVSDSLLDAAKVDGASIWRTFFTIILPITRPALLTLFLISFIGTWNNFFLPLVILHSSSLYPLPLGIENQLSLINTAGADSTAPLYPLIITGSMLSILPMIVGFAFFNKYIVAGLTQGSVKL